MDDFEMAKYPGLTLRNGDGMWQVRKRIPVDLQHIDRRGSIRKTLGTRNIRGRLQADASFTSGKEQGGGVCVRV